MKRRSLFALPVALVCLVLAGSHAVGTTAAVALVRPRRRIRAAPHTHRVIVQAPTQAGSRRCGAASPACCAASCAAPSRIEVNDAQLDALQQQSALRATSRATCRSSPTWRSPTRSPAPTRCGRARPAAARAGGTPGYTGTGVGVAILDSGIATHTALDSRVVARVNLVSDEPGVDRRSVRPRHARRRHHRRQPDRGVRP